MLSDQKLNQYMSGNIKLTDFGMATLFRNKEGVERLMDRRCGTPPYVAPEVCWC